MGKRNGIMAAWLVLSKDKVLKDHALICEDGLITDIVPNEKALGMEGLIDARDCIVTPGFVNTHCHMYNRVARGYEYHQKAKGLIPMLWEYWWSRIEDQIDHERIRITTTFSCADLLTNGVTCVDDILEAPNSVPGCLPIEAEILNKAGLRGILSIESSERNGRENGELCLKENYDFIKRQREDPKQLVFGMMCTHTTFSCSADFLRLAQSMAHELGSDIQIHCSEGGDESRWCLEHFNKLPMEYYEEIGFLDSNLLASQCVIMDPVEIALMKRRGVRVSHQPNSNSECGCGIAPVADYIAEGIPMGIGTDGENNNILEMMRWAAYLQRAKRMDAGVGSGRDLFHAGTKGGATAIGYPNIGELAVGKAADYVAIDISDITTPVNEKNVWNQIVFYRENKDVRDVVVNGEQVVQNGVCLTIDQKAANKAMRECTEQYWEDLDNGKY